MENIADFKVTIHGSDYSCILQICEDLWEDNHDRKLSEEIVNLNPDIILCNSYVYNFCNKVEGYELIYINSDYGIEIYKRIFN